ncbi:hypothetical protein K456DRAFT_55383 [Colletotrichum gloeosporioides 23]|nr:hypothetical protein K456DRAFT_55383 [Colletotrichum gloeosporioides 23]
MLPDPLCTSRGWLVILLLLLPQPVPPSGIQPVEIQPPLKSPRHPYFRMGSTRRRGVTRCSKLEGGGYAAAGCF